MAETMIVPIVKEDDLKELLRIKCNEHIQEHGNPEFITYAYAYIVEDGMTYTDCASFDDMWKHVKTLAFHNKDVNDIYYCISYDKDPLNESLIYYEDNDVCEITTLSYIRQMKIYCFNDDQYFRC